MVDPIEPISLLRKKKISFHQYMPPAMPSPVWPGTVAPPYFTKLIHEGDKRVIEATSLNVQAVRKDHEKEKRVQFRRLFLNGAANAAGPPTNFFRRNLVKIPLA